MPTTRLISSFWELAREQSAEGELVRRRIAAIGATTVGLSGLLFAIGLGVVVLLFFAGVVATVALAAFFAVWRRLRMRRRDYLARVREFSGTTRGHLVRVSRSLRGAVSKGVVRASARNKTLARAVVACSARAGGAVGQSAHAAMIRFAPRGARHDLKREAIALNAMGTQHRRNGRYEEAVECHRQALEHLRGLDDRRCVALTQSNLALALSSAGDYVWAVGLFEEAAATLRELGDEEHEGQIMANLGVTHRRHGRPEEADNVFELALSKLSSDSSAYQAIEAELRRAS